MKVNTKHCKTRIYKSPRPHGSTAEDLNVFSYCRSMGANGSQGVANLDPRDIIGKIYVGHHLLLHTKYTSFRPCGF